MRIATFNILSGRTPSADAVDEARYQQAIATLDADVLGLQEVDRDQPRSGGADLTVLAAEAMGAVHHRFVPALWGTPGSRWSAATGEEPPEDRARGAAYGIALLSRYPVLGWQVVRLPQVRLRVPHLFPGTRRPVSVREEPRTAVLAELDTPLGRIRVATTHLSYLPWWNGRQLRALDRSMGRGDVPTILTGDLNMRPRRAERISRMRSLASGPTFPEHDPTVQLDHILVDRALEVVSGGPVALPVSDHRALVVELADPNAF